MSCSNWRYQNRIWPTLKSVIGLISFLNIKSEYIGKYDFADAKIIYGVIFDFAETKTSRNSVEAEMEYCDKFFRCFLHYSFAL